MLLAGKVAIVTGGGSGIGKAISEDLAKNGAKVAVASRSPSHLEAAVESFKKLDRPLLPIRMDVRKKAAVQKGVASVVATWGAVDILVNNAGISGLNRMDDPDDSRWYDIVETNLTGMYLITKEVLKVMRDHSDGRIISISSVLGKFGVPGYSAYCASKHGVIGFTRALALEVVDRGITANTICPGWVDTEKAPPFRELRSRNSKERLSRPCRSRDSSPQKRWPIGSPISPRPRRAGSRVKRSTFAAARR